MKFSKTLLRNRLYNRNRFDFGALFVHARWETIHGVMAHVNTKHDGFEKEYTNKLDNNSKIKKS